MTVEFILNSLMGIPVWFCCMVCFYFGKSVKDCFRPCRVLLHIYNSVDIAVFRSILKMDGNLDIVVSIMSTYVLSCFLSLFLF